MTSTLYALAPFRLTSDSRPATVRGLSERTSPFGLCHRPAPRKALVLTLDAHALRRLRAGWWRARDGALATGPTLSGLDDRVTGLDAAACRLPEATDGPRAQGLAAAWERARDEVRSVLIDQALAGALVRERRLIGVCDLEATELTWRTEPALIAQGSCRRLGRARLLGALMSMVRAGEARRLAGSLRSIHPRALLRMVRDGVGAEFGWDGERVVDARRSLGGLLGPGDLRPLLDHPLPSLRASALEAIGRLEAP